MKKEKLVNILGKHFPDVGKMILELYLLVAYNDEMLILIEKQRRNEQRK